MMQNKKVVGITGGSGSGKSHISALLRASGFPVIDADEVAHDCLNKSGCIKELVSEFGGGILRNGLPDRKKLGEIVFSDAKKLEKLNEITHKYILSDIFDKISASEGDTVFVDGAVLIESGMDCDFMVGVIADKGIRKNRIIKRDKITETEAERRIFAQQEDSFYLENCDLVIENNSGEPDISEIIKRLHI